MDLAGYVTSIRSFFDICLFLSFFVPSLSSPFIFPFSSLSLSDFTNHEILLLYDSKDGAWRGEGGGQGSETATHNKKKWVSGFSIRAYTLASATTITGSSPLPALRVVFMCEQEHFIEYVGGVISL